MKRVLFVCFCLAVIIVGCKPRVDVNSVMNTIAERYVKTVLEVGLYDPLYIDAYYGPHEWRMEAEANKENHLPKERLIHQIDSIKAILDSLDMKDQEQMLKLRHIYLFKQLQAVRAHVEMMAGKSYSFDQESAALYDAVVPPFKDEYFMKIIGQLEALLPGKGNLIERLGDFRNDFVIPVEKVDTVFKASIAEARRRTLEHIDLPSDENFVIEYVHDKVWAGYNWYKGNNFSLIQVNIDFPILIDRAIDLASHEGYPGHHVYNSLLETNMVKQRKWMEFAVYPLFSPQSLIAEGTANFGIDVVFPKADRMKFEREVLFPLAGLDSGKVDLYYKIKDLVQDLTYARTKAMRFYLDGEWSKEKTISWMNKYALRGTEESSFSFPETYGSYIINYNWGKDLVKSYIEGKGGTTDNPDKRWEIFTYLVSTPQVPSQLK